MAMQVALNRRREQDFGFQICFDDFARASRGLGLVSVIVASEKASHGSSHGHLGTYDVMQGLGKPLRMQVTSLRRV